MRTIVLLAAIVLGSLTQAQAQPGPDSAPPPPADPQPYPPPPPPPYPAPPTYAPAYPVAPQLTPEEQALLAKGEISNGAQIGGAVVNVMFGFGIGQAVQGRYGDTGWIFTLGEAASMTALIAGIGQELQDCPLFSDSACTSHRGDGLVIGGLVGYGVFHIWSIVDAITGPANHNRRVRELRARLGMPQMYSKQVIPYVIKHDGDVTAGITIRF